jgi:DNA-binding response OmpR family regulator
MSQEKDSGPGRGTDGAEEQGEPGRLEDVRVLIVDDDPDIQESIDAAFQAEGALTQTVSDGNEAVRICREDPPDLVVLDMMLPKRSGFLVLEKIKGHEESPIVIMVTANEGKRHQDYAQALGVDRYMIKPVPLGKLIDTACELLDAEAAEMDDEDADAPAESKNPPKAEPKRDRGDETREYPPGFGR